MAEKYATIEKVSEGFELAKSRFDEIEMTVDEAKDCIKQLQNQLRQMHAMSVPLGDGASSGQKFWPCEDMAKEFGEAVLKAIGKKDLGVGVPSGAGVLVPDQAVRRFIDMLGLYGRFRRHATLLPLDSASALVPRLTTDMTISCPGEGKPLEKSQPMFDQIRLTPKTWGAICAVSKELDDDSVIAVGTILGNSIARSLSRQEDRVGFLGDGSETYFGMTGICGKLLKLVAANAEDDDPNVAGVVVQSSAGNWNTYDLGDFYEMDARLPEEAEENAKWFCSKTFYSRVMRGLAVQAGAANIFEILSDKKSKYFLGYEVVPVSCMPRTPANGQIDCLLADLEMSAYLGQRRELTIERSDDAYFGNYQVGVRGVERIDINVFGTGTKTSAGPIVALLSDTGE